MKTIAKWAAITTGGLALLLAGPAQARTLDKSDAAREARLALSEYADYRCDQRLRCDFASYPELTRYDCFWFDRRRSAHCVGSVNLYFGDNDYLNEHCIATVTIRPRRNPRVFGWECL